MNRKFQPCFSPNDGSLAGAVHTVMDSGVSSEDLAQLHSELAASRELFTKIVSAFEAEGTGVDEPTSYTFPPICNVEKIIVDILTPGAEGAVFTLGPADDPDGFLSGVSGLPAGLRNKTLGALLPDDISSGGKVLVFNGNAACEGMVIDVYADLTTIIRPE